MALLRSWVQIPPGPLYSNELFHYHESDFFPTNNLILPENRLAYRVVADLQSGKVQPVDHATARDRIEKRIRDRRTR